MAGSDPWVLHAHDSLPGQSLEVGRDGCQPSAEAMLVPGTRHFRKTIRVSDDHSSEAQELCPHELGEKCLGEIGQYFFRIPVLCKSCGHPLQNLRHLIGRGSDDRSIKLAFILKMLVDRRLETAASAAISSMLVPSYPFSRKAFVAA